MKQNLTPPIKPNTKMYGVLVIYTNCSPFYTANDELTITLLTTATLLYLLLLRSTSSFVDNNEMSDIPDAPPAPEWDLDIF